MERLTRSLLVIALAATVAASLAACKPKPVPDDKAVTADDISQVRVGSISDTEGSVLGQMVIRMLESGGIETVDRTKLGTSELCRKAITQGEVDITVDYTGSGRYYHEDLAAQDVWSDAEKAYLTIYKADSDRKDLIWLEPAPADGAEVLCTTKDVSDQFGVRSMEDFARYVNGGGDVRLVCSRAFAEGDEGLKGMEAAYGFELQPGQLIAKADGDTAAMLDGLAAGTDGANFSLAFATDGKLDDLGLVTLADPESVPPVREPSAVVRGVALRAYPEIEGLLEPVFASLTAETLRGLNRRVAFGGEEAEAVAEEYLTANGFLK